MLYKIKKPEDVNEFPSWVTSMDYLDGKIINLDDYEIIHESDYDYDSIEIDMSWTINIAWVHPLQENNGQLLLDI